MTTKGKETRAEQLEKAVGLKRAAARSGRSQLSPRPDHQDAHLGELQRSLWLLYQMDPSSPAYHLASAFRVPGVLNASRLEESLNGIVSRHRILRSTFRAREDGVLQVTHSHTPLEIERTAALDGDPIATAVREARKPFDLEAGPLVRLLLIEDPSESLLVLVLHHILADERSLDSMWRELAAGYNGKVSHAPQRLQYDDYVYWQAQLPPRRREEDLEYWRQKLSPPPDDLMLPFERRTTEVTPARGRLLRRSVGSELRGQIRRVAAATGTTPFITCAYVFRLLLHRYSEGRDVAFATPASMRSHPATSEMIGYFLNPLVVRTQIHEQQSVGSAIRTFGAEMRSYLTHASVPFDVLVQELLPVRQRNLHPIFQSMFVYQEEPPPPELGGVQLEPLTLDLGESKFDLTMFALQRADAMEVAVEYRADRFDQIWMEKLLGHYANLLGGLEQGLEHSVADLQMLPPEESASIAKNSLGAPLAAAESELLPQKLLARAEESAQAQAVIGPGEEWSYSELEGAGRKIARKLQMCGVKPGDRVGLFLDRSPLVIAGMLGTHWAGAAYVPLDPAYPPARNRQVLEDAEVSAVLTRTSLENKVPSGFRHTLAIDDLAARRTLSRESPPVTGADLPAYILYTSGSTGRPKGVVVTHGNLRASTAARVQVYGAPPKRFLLLPSIAFDSSVAGIFWTLAEGGALVIPSDDEVRDPERLARLVAKEKVTSLLCVPSLYAYMLEGGAEELQTLETVIVAGESCRPQLVKEHFRTLPEARLFNEYGPTEATVWATVHEIRPSDKEKQVPIGRPIPGVRVEVLDAMGRYVPAGIPGEGWISGPTVAQGYWGRQGLADDRFISGSREDGSEARKYRSGDRMTWTADGKLLFLGRIDEQVKLRGFRIEPGEIESVLHEHPQVEEAAVVVRAPEHLVAFAVTSEPIADWRDQLTNRLPDFMVPSRLVELPELPRLPNSKVDRRRLREMDLDPEKRTDAASQVLGDREQALVSIWESLLGRTGIGIGDNFFELGGHSLLVVAMTSAIERELGVRLAPADIFQSPTIGEITKRIEHQEDSASPSYAHLFPIEPQGHRNPFIFCVPHFFSEMVANRFRGERPVYGLRGVSLRPEGNRGRWRTMTDLGEELVQEICGRFPNETLIIAGYSFGATMAVETVRLLEERGVPVDYLYLIAPMPIDFYRFGPLSLQIDGLRQPIEDLSIGEALRALANTNHPLTLRPYRRAWRQLAIQPWRRLLCLAGKLRILAGLPLTPRILHADVRVERFRLHAGYRPGHVSTPTVIFNAREPQTDAAATWRPYFIGPFTVHQIPDPHLDESSIAAAKKQILHHLRDLGTE